MPARCSLPGSDAFAASIGLGSIVKASALLKRDLDEYKFVVQPMVVGKGRLLTDGLNRAASKKQIPISN